MAEILAHRLGEILGMIDQQRDRAVDAVGADRQAFGHRGGKAGALRFERALHPRGFAGDIFLDGGGHDPSPHMIAPV